MPNEDIGNFDLRYLDEQATKPFFDPGALPTAPPVSALESDIAHDRLEQLGDFNIQIQRESDLSLARRIRQRLLSATRDPLYDMPIASNPIRDIATKIYGVSSETVPDYSGNYLASVSDVKAAYDGDLIDWWSGIVGAEDYHAPQERVREQAKRDLEELKALGVDTDAWERELEFANSQPERVRRALFKVAELRQIEQTLAATTAGRSMWSGIKTWAISPSREVDRLLTALSVFAPAGFAAHRGWRATAEAFGLTGVMEAGIVAPDEFARARILRDLTIAARDVDTAYDEVFADAWKNVGVAGLFGGVLGGGARGIYEGLRALSSPKKVKAADAAKPDDVPPDVPPDDGVPFRGVADDGEGVVGGRAYRAAKADGEGEEIIIRNPREVSKEEFDDIKGDKTAQAVERQNKHGGIVEEGGGRAMKFDEPEPTAPETPDLAKRLADETERFEVNEAAPPVARVMARIREFEADLPQGEETGGKRTIALKPAEEGKPGAFMLGGRSYANRLPDTPENARAIAAVNKTYQILRGGGNDIPTPDEVLAIQNGRLVFRPDIEPDVVGHYAFTFGSGRTPNPMRVTAGSQARALLNGEDYTVGDTVSHNLAEEYRGAEYQKQADATAAGVAADIEAARFAPGTARALAATRGRDYPDDILDVADDLDEQGAVLDMFDEIRNRNSYVADTPRMVGAFNRAFHMGANATDRAIAYQDIMIGGFHLGDNALADHAEFVLVLHAAGKSAREIADIVEETLKPETAKITKDGRVTGVDAEGKKKTRKNVSVKTDADGTRRVARSPGPAKSRNPLVNSFRRQEWVKTKPSKAWRAREKQIPRNPLIKFIVESGGLKLPPARPKYKRKKGEKRGITELQIFSGKGSGLPPKFWRTDGREDWDDMLERGFMSPEVEDVIRANFPEVVEGDGFNFNNIEGGSREVMRQILAAEIGGGKGGYGMLGEADARFLETDPDDWEKGISAYESETMARALEEEAALHKRVGFVPRDKLRGMLYIGKRNGIDNPAKATEEQVLQIERIFDAEEKTRLNRRVKEYDARQHKEAATAKQRAEQQRQQQQEKEWMDAERKAVEEAREQNETTVAIVKDEKKAAVVAARVRDVNLPEPEGWWDGKGSWEDDPRLADTKVRSVVYHGSSDFVGDEFDKSFVGKNTKEGLQGFFFTSERGNAAEYAFSRLLQDAEHAEWLEVTIGKDQFPAEMKALGDVIDEIKGRVPDAGDVKGYRYDTPTLTPQSKAALATAVRNLHVAMKGKKLNAKLTQKRKMLEKLLADLDAPAKGRGESVVPVRLSMKKPLEYDYKGAYWDEATHRRVIDDARAKGRDGVIFRNVRDSLGALDTGGVKDPQPGTVYAVFEPEQIINANTGVTMSAKQGDALTAPPKSRQDPTPGRTGNKEIPPLKNQTKEGAGVLTEGDGRPLTQGEGEDPLLAKKTAEENAGDGVLWSQDGLFGIMPSDNADGGFVAITKGGKRLGDFATELEAQLAIEKARDPDAAAEMTALDLARKCGGMV